MFPTPMVNQNELTINNQIIFQKVDIRSFVTLETKRVPCVIYFLRQANIFARNKLNIFLTGS
jgi:hypothetical protein